MSLQKCVKGIGMAITKVSAKPFSRDCLLFMSAYSIIIVAAVPDVIGHSSEKESLWFVHTDWYNEAK